MEINALVVQQSEIKFNREEIQESLDRIKTKYANLVFTEDEVTNAKEERAKLNKLAAGLAKYRKDIVSEATAPIKSFEDFMKESEAIAKDLAKDIDNQIKVFEDVQKEERIKKSKEYIENKFAENEKYREFESMFIFSDSVYSNKGSYTAAGNVGSKLVEHIDGIFKQMDDIFTGREAEQKLLDEKRNLVISSCKNVSEMLELEIPLDPKTFTYLKTYDLQEIVTEIQAAGKRAKEQQEEKIAEIKKREYENAQKELEKTAEVKEEIKEEVTPEVKTEENEVSSSADILEEPKKEKLFYAEFSIDGIPVPLAKELSAWLKSKGVKYTVISQNLK